MKLKVGCSLKQLLETYGKEAKIPELLVNEKVSIYGFMFIEAFRKKESWIDTAVETYLTGEDFYKDLQKAEKCLENRLESCDYWLQLECDSNHKIRLNVDMDMKDF